jgi:hypothetical protein
MPSTKSPVSEKRLAANRANAARSTGPRTPEGKARSSRNAVKHGFTGSHFAVVRLEDVQEIARLKSDAVACYQPVNAQELFAVERIAIAQQMILRAARLEAGLFTDALSEAMDCTGHPIIPMSPDIVDGDLPITRAQNRNYALAEGVRRLSRESNLFPLMLRYQAQAERLYRRAVEDFERLKALRPEMPNEPIAPDEADEKQDVATLDDLNTIVPGAFTEFAYTPHTSGSAENPAPSAPPSGRPRNKLSPADPVTLDTTRH